nr:protein FON2 SPARE1-like [Coffea arabica]
MSLKNIGHFLMIILWLYFLLLLFHGWEASSTSFIRLQSGKMHQFSTSHYNRKAMAPGKFDFTPFLHHHHRHHHHRRDHHHRHIAVEREPPDDGSGLDPLYGIDKRLVPTGPNPLHH